MAKSCAKILDIPALLNNILNSLFYFCLPDNGTVTCALPNMLLCDNSTKCIYGSLVYSDSFGYICDGHRHCEDGQDENVDECRSRNLFPKEATIQCLEASRPEEYPVTIMAVPCDGMKECKNGEDEEGCDISIIYLLCALTFGFAVISIAAGLFNNCHKQTKTFVQINPEGSEQNDLSKQNDLSFKEGHQDINRSKKIAFYQGASDRRLQNQALIAFETSFHGSLGRAMLCLKAST